MYQKISSRNRNVLFLKFSRVFFWGGGSMCLSVRHEFWYQPYVSIFLWVELLYMDTLLFFSVTLFPSDFLSLKECFKLFNSNNFFLNLSFSYSFYFIFIYCHSSNISLSVQICNLLPWLNLFLPPSSWSYLFILLNARLFVCLLVFSNLNMFVGYFSLHACVSPEMYVCTCVDLTQVLFISA